MVAASAAVVVGLPVTAHAAPGPLTITPKGWNVVGLRSNNVNDGPNKYMVGAEVCNTGTDPVADVTTTWVWDQANVYVNLDGSATRTIDSIAAGACRDTWYVVEVTRDAAAFNTSRDFRIEASAPGQATVSTPAGREIYVRSLIRQNRNSVSSITGPSAVEFGGTYTYTINASTSTTYEQLATTGVFATSIFEVQSVTLTYSDPAPGGTVSDFYVDACGWDPDPASPTYLSCSTAGKAGRATTITVVVKVVGVGNANVTAVIYDLSGGSYHYNSDYGNPPNDLAITATYPATAPNAVDDTATTAEDTPVTIDVLANDSDINGDLDPATLAVATQPANGTATKVGNQVQYTPDADWYGTDSFTYEVCDAGGLCSTATVTVTVTPVNDAPVAVDDTASVDEDDSVVIDVLANDVDVDGNLDPTSVSVTVPPSNGSVSVDPVTGEITYTPDPDFAGMDSFSYEVCDTDGLCDTATVVVTVNQVNDAPVAVDDSVSVDEDDSVLIDVLVNDSDVDDGLDPSSVSVTSGPANGSTSVDPVTGEITYTPDPDFHGTDSFTYQVCDFTGACDSATVSITVDPVNDAPVAVDDTASVDEDDSVVIDVLANDSDVDGNLDPTSVTVTVPPANGSTSVDPVTGEITYTPDPDYYGPDSFSYEVCDTDGACDTATVSITVDPVNDAPVAADDSATTPMNTPVAVDVLVNDSDVDGNLDPTSVTVTSGPANGSVSVDPVTGEITYTPDADWYGTDSFSYEVCDTDDACDSATVSVTVTEVNLAPVAVDDTASVDEDDSVVIDVLANDTDVNGNLDPTSVSVTSGPSNGSVSVDPVTGEITYTPDPDFAGMDSFSYEVCDTDGLCDTATVVVTVNQVNDAPVAVDDSVSVDEDDSVLIDVLVNDSDVDDGLDPSSVSVTVPPANGSTSVDPVTGEITYTPDPDYYGPDSFTYEVCDFVGACAAAVVTVTVDPVNDAPVATDDTASVDEDDSVVIDVDALVSDVDGDVLTVTITTGPAHGSLTDNGDGTWTYTPDPDYFGPDSFSYEVCDPDGACDTGTVDITVDPVNDAPVAVDDSVSTSQNVDVDVNLGLLVSDVDLDPLTITISSGPTHGSLTPLGGGVWTYTPDAGYFGPDSFTYEVCDPDGACDTGTISIDVNANGPLPADDTASTDEDTAVVIDVLANDTDPDGNLDPTSVSVTIPPAHGSTSVDMVTGEVTYTPDADWYGTDTFSYEVCDSDGFCATAEVTVTVDPVNDAPVAGDDSVTVDEDDAVVIDLDALASDVDGDPLTITISTGPTHGTLSPNGDGTWTYTPDPDYYGPDSFTYEVCDDASPVLCATGTVDITVNPINDGPSAADDSATTDEDVPVTIDVLANDVDIDDGLDPDSVTVIGAPANGSTSVDPVTGEITYTPDTDWFGTDSFTYEVCDFTGACATADVTVVVSPVNDAPVANDDLESTDEDMPVSIDVLANDTDVEGDLLSVTSATDGSNGTTTVNGDGTITYTPDANWHGTDTFTYEVCDPSGACSTATVTVTVNSVNDAPNARNDSASVDEDDVVDIDVLANDEDPDGDLLTVTSTTDGAHGTTSINGDGTVRYTPDPDWFGTDSFTYTACDPDGLCDTATVTVTVDPVNDAPVAVDDSATVGEGGSLAIDVLANDSDVDGSLDPGTVTVTSDPSNGSTSVDPATGEVTYTPDLGFSGADSFEYEVCDDGTPVLCATATVDITVVANGAPDAVDDSATTDEDSSVDIDVLANDTDPEGHALTVTSSTDGAHGTTSINGDGTVRYTPDPDWFGTDSFTYTVCDSLGGCASATVTVTVDPVNDAPVANDDADTTDEDTAVTLDVLANDSDIDGSLDPTTVSVTSGPANGGTSVNAATGAITYTPDPGFHGTDSFVYQVCDDGAPVLCATATASVTVNAVNGPPVANADSRTIDEDGRLVFDPRNNDVDPDGDPLTVTSVTQPVNGTVTIRPDGRIRYVPDPDWHGTDTFTYTVCDPDGLCDTASVTVTVLPQPDAPVANDDALTVRDGKPIVIHVLGNDDDADGDPLTVTVVQQPQHGTVEVLPNGDIRYTPDPTYSGTDSFVYQICDPDGNCDRATVRLTLIGSSETVPNEPRPPREPNTPAPPPLGGPLPKTGAEVTRLAIWGLTLVLGGALLLAGTRRRVTG